MALKVSILVMVYVINPAVFDAISIFAKSLSSFTNWLLKYEFSGSFGKSMNRSSILCSPLPSKLSCRFL